MGIFKNSTFGTIRKSIGDDVTYRMGGQNIIRKKPAYTRDANTEPQRARRMALSLIVDLFRKNISLVKMNFRNREQKHSAYNAFASVNLLNAIVIAGAIATINWLKLSISKGSLPSPAFISSNQTGEESLEIIINPQVDDQLLFSTDILKFVGISPTTGRKVVDAILDPSSSDVQNFDCSDEIVESGFYGYLYHASSDGSKVSDSVCIGIIE